MNHGEFQDALIRLADGQSLSANEIASLDASLNSLSPLEEATLSRDLTIHDLLRAVYLHDDDTSADASESFVECVKARIASPAVAVAPPIEEPPIEELPIQSWDLQLSLDSKTAPPARASMKAGVPKQRMVRWSLVASAAAVALALITAFGISNRLGSEAPTASDKTSPRNQAPSINTSPERETSSERLMVVEEGKPTGSSPAILPPGGVAEPSKDVAEQSSSTGRRDQLAANDGPARSDSPADAPQGLANSDADVSPAIKSIDGGKDAEASAVRSETLHAATQPTSLQAAVMMDDSSAQWRDGKPTSKDLVRGVLSLESGTAQLKLSRGAEVELIGRVDLELVDDNRVKLVTGRLQATVPPQASGFEVRTPGARIVDLGTRFEVHTLPQDELTRVDVLEGVVEVIQSNERQPHRARKFQLSKGFTKWLSFDGLSAWDWRLVVEYGDPKNEPNQLSINGRTFDVGRPDQTMLAMRQLQEAFADASQQISILPPGQRFAGEMWVDGERQRLTTARQLNSALVELRQSLQRRWANGMFNNIFQNGMQRQMEDFFNGNGIFIPGESP